MPRTKIGRVTLDYQRSEDEKQSGPKSEVRRAVRRAIDLECLVYCDLYGESIELGVSDLSEDGLWVDTQLPLDVGTRVTVSFQPDDWDSPLCVIGKVQRVQLPRRNEDLRASGMGIGFELLRADERRRLSDTLRRLRPSGARSVTDKTLIGVPVGPVAKPERRATDNQTKLGWSSPMRDLVPASAKHEKQERRASWPPAPTRTVTTDSLRGGLRLISSVFGGETK